MVAVNTTDAIKYGFRLLGYLLAVFVAGGVLIMVGAGFMPTGFSGGNPILGLLFWIAGIVVIYAGSLGMLYKVIADGVEIGNRAADQPAGQPQGGYQQGGQAAAPQGGGGR